MPDSGTRARVGLGSGWAVVARTQPMLFPILTEMDIQTFLQSTSLLTQVDIQTFLLRLPFSPRWTSKHFSIGSFIRDIHMRFLRPLSYLDMGL